MSPTAPNAAPAGALKLALKDALERQRTQAAGVAKPAASPKSTASAASAAASRAPATTAAQPGAPRAPHASAQARAHANQPVGTSRFALSKPRALPAASGADDAQLLAKLQQSITPLKGSQRVSTQRVQHAAPASASTSDLAQRRQAAAQGLDAPTPVDLPLSDLAAVDHLLNQDGASFLRPSQRPDTLKRLRRGHWPVRRELDLHGLQVDAARQALVAFLELAVLQALRCVRIIHGKGYGSQSGQPVLRERTRGWLVQHPDVLAFTHGPARDGGEGALLVLLKASRASEHSADPAELEKNEGRNG